MHEAAQTVGAHQEAVTPAKLEEREIYADLLGGAQGLQDDVGVLEGLRLVLGELTSFDQLIDEALVLGDLLELAARKM